MSRQGLLCAQEFDAGVHCQRGRPAGSGDSTVDLRYLGLKVSQNHLKERSEQQMRQLLSQKKLVVVLDLDHTMLHTELKCHLRPEVLPPNMRLNQCNPKTPHSCCRFTLADDSDW